MRWHRYLYAGYDMVGSCPDLDFFVTPKDMKFFDETKAFVENYVI